MNNESSPRLLLSRRFTSFEELAAIVIAWDFDFHQLSKNYSDTELVQMQAGNILFSHLSCGCFSTHTGNTPENMCTIGLPDAGCTAFRYFDHHIDRPVLLVTTPGQDFDLIARPGYGISTFSIPKPLLERHLETSLDCSLDVLSGGGNGVIPVSQQTVTDLRTMVANLSGFAQHPSNPPGRFDSAQSLESRLLESLARSLLQGERTNMEPDAETRSRILRRAREYTRDHGHETIGVRDLAAATNTSERTLERVFKSEFGISPKKYLLGERMYGVHRQLWQSDPSGTSVADVANAWGFWHMGQFARDYRSLFGVLPSETLNRSRASRFI